MSVFSTTIGQPDVCTFRDLVFPIEGRRGSLPPESGPMIGIRSLHPGLLWTLEQQGQTVAWAESEPLLQQPHRVLDDLLSGSGVTLDEWKAGHQQFTNWGPGHFLNVGEISAVVAVGFDWIYDALHSDERIQIRHGITSLRLTNDVARYGANEWWHNDKWNRVCSAGPLLTALAFAGRGGHVPP